MKKLIAETIRSVRPSDWLLAIVVAALVIVAFGGCASIRSILYPALGSVTGAVIGSPAGPPGIFGGGAAGAALGSAVGQNAELRSGDLKGAGAWQKEVEYWKDQATNLEGLARTEQKAKSFLQSAYSKVILILWIIAGWTLIKYCWPRSRAAKNFWGGLFRIVRGEARSGVRHVISATGIVPAEKPA